MSDMAELEEGQYVRFFRSHDRTHALSGLVVDVRDDEVLIESEPDGVPIWANARDVTPIEEKAPDAADATDAIDATDASDPDPAA